MASLYDGWSLIHFVSGIALGAVADQLPVSGVSQALFVLAAMWIWELVECCGRRNGCTGGLLPAMWQPERLANSWIGDIAAGGTGAVLGYSLAADTDVSGGVDTVYYVLTGFILGILLHAVWVPGAWQVVLTAVGIVAWALLGDTGSPLHERLLMHPLGVVLGSSVGYEISFRAHTTDTPGAEGPYLI